MCLTEIWKDVQGFEGRYQVSNMGRVRSLDRWSLDERPHFIKGMMLKPSPNKGRGYLRISFSDGRRNYKHYEVHRLVALHFVHGYKEGLVVNHINEIKTDNRADNLEWCTRQYNLTYNELSKRVGISQGKPVEQMTLNGEVIAVFPSVSEAGRATGLAATHISDSCHSDRKTCGGYRWKFKEQ